MCLLIWTVFLRWAMWSMGLLIICVTRYSWNSKDLSGFFLDVNEWLALSGNPFISKHPTYIVLNGIQLQMQIVIFITNINLLDLYFFFLLLSLYSRHRYIIVNMITMDNIIPIPRRRWDLFELYRVSLCRVEHHV